MKNIKKSMKKRKSLIVNLKKTQEKIRKVLKKIDMLEMKGKGLMIRIKNLTSKKDKSTLKNQRV